MATKNGKGGKLARSETVTVRLDPKLRYLAELAARRQRRTLSSYIEWAIETSLNHVPVREGNQLSIRDVAEQLWDVEDADRFARLALSYSEMLTYGEQRLWKLVRENGYLWKGGRNKYGKWTWNVCHASLILPRLRKHWEVFKRVAEGTATPVLLPDCGDDAPPALPPPPPEGDEDIPF